MKPRTASIAAALLLMTLALTLTACTDSYKGSVAGSVTSERPSPGGTPTPYPLADAEVTIHSNKTGEDFVTYTDAAGEYQAGDIPFGLSKVTVFKDGYRETEKYADIAKDNRTTLDFVVPEIPKDYFVNFLVTVVDPDGRPIPNATIDVYSRSFADYGYTKYIDTHLATWTTDASGRAAFLDVVSLGEFEVWMFRIDSVAYGYRDAQLLVMLAYTDTNSNITLTMERQTP